MCFGIVVAEWNPEITGALLDGAVKTLEKHGALTENIHVKTVPGSFELIYGAHQMVLNGGYDAVIILGYDAYSGQQHNGRQGFGNQGYSRQQSYEGERNSFMFSLLVLSSYIINADGKIMHSEMEMVRRFLRQNFGEAAKQQGEEILLKLFEQQKQMGMQQYRSVIQDSCHQIRANMMYEQRLQLLNFLVMIAQADGVVNSQEIQALKEMAIHMGLSAEDVDQMLNLESGASSAGSLDDAYRVLGISPDASNDEVKAAYRKMALKHHPDKVAALGEDVRRAAEKKFQEINDAKDRIYKARGI